LGKYERRRKGEVKRGGERQGLWGRGEKISYGTTGGTRGNEKENVLKEENLQQAGDTGKR